MRFARGKEYRVAYQPGEATPGLCGGNSIWCGPVWWPVNYLLVEALERYYHFYGDTFQAAGPTGSNRLMNLREVSDEIASRLAGIFLPDGSRRRPCHGDGARLRDDPPWQELVLFHEYFHGETGRDLGAGHQTGWTALVIRRLQDRGKPRVPQVLGQ